MKGGLVPKLLGASLVFWGQIRAALPHDLVITCIKQQAMLAGKCYKTLSN
jgi:hypothetical protein